MDSNRAVGPTSTVSGARNSKQTTVVFLLVFVPLFLIYSATAQWSQPYHIDAMTNAITGWYVGNEGTVIAGHHQVLTQPQHRGNLGWFVQSPSGPVSQYPPGAAAWTGLFYALTPGDLELTALTGSNQPDQPPVSVPIPPMWPATLAAVVATAGAAAVMAMVWFRTNWERAQAIVAGLAFGLATTAWTVASAMSWTHGVAMLSIALGVLGVQSDRWVLGGAAFGFAILTRPHIAVIAAFVGLGIALTRRQLKPALLLGASSSLGLVALLLYNHWLWDKLTISGGYGDGFTDRLVDSSPVWFLENIFGGLFDLSHGLFVWAPFLVLLAAGALASHRQQPDWATWAALGGIAYLLIQWRANRFSGGEGHFAYRYPLEMLIAAAPSALVGYVHWIRPRRLLRWALWVALAWSVVVQALHAAPGVPI